MVEGVFFVVLISSVHRIRSLKLHIFFREDPPGEDTTAMSSCRIVLRADRNQKTCSDVCPAGSFTYCGG